MNCFNHTEEVAVSSCADCGKGLCKSCSSLYEMPICNECNLRRVKSDKSNILKIYLPSVVLFLIGLLPAIAGGDIVRGLVQGWIYAGIP